MRARTLMVQGTASHVGKSLLTAAFCRILTQEGYRVAPFKAQNMSLNAAVCDGGEIGRAQALQAAACRRTATVDMNPLLLKPCGSGGCQLIVQGQPAGFIKAAEHGRYPAAIVAAVEQSFERLATSHDVVVLEGAGSPAEVNLLDRDIANMWMAERADAPVLLVGDIERGGVFASLLGTWLLVPQATRIRGFLINKFRGDASLLTPGLEFLRQRTGVPVLGVVPYGDPQLPEEDSLGLANRRMEGDGLQIGVVRLPHLANFTDFEPLQRHPGVTLRYVATVEELQQVHVVIVPGTRSTVDDLAWLRGTGLADALRRRAGAATPVLGICGGFQMLGASIADDHGVESREPLTAGLGLLPVRTRFDRDKVTDHVTVALLGTEERGPAYRIHHGRVMREDGAALFHIQDAQGQLSDEGSRRGRTWGTTLHGIFDDPGVRQHILRMWAAWCGVRLPEQGETKDDLDVRLDAWAGWVRQAVAVPEILALTGVAGGRSA